MVIAKWKSVRDGHLKSKKKEIEINKSGSAKRPCHKYIYADKLGFLEKFMQLREPEANAVSNLTNDSEEPIGENTSKSNPDTSSVRRSTKYKKNRYADISSYIKEARELMEKRTKEDNDDEDMSFFKSILPTVRKLNPDQKMQFRIHIMSYLQGLSAMQGQAAIQQLFQQSTMYHNYQQPPPHNTYFPPSEAFFQTGQTNPRHRRRLSQTSPSYNQQSSSTEGASNASTPSYNHQYSDDDFS